MNCDGGGLGDGWRDSHPDETVGRHSRRDWGSFGKVRWLLPGKGQYTLLPAQERRRIEMYPQSHEPACQCETVVGCPETLVAPQTSPEWPKGLGGQWCKKPLPGRWKQWTGLCSVLWPSPAIGAGYISCQRWTDPSWSCTVTQEGSFLWCSLLNGPAWPSLMLSLPQRAGICHGCFHRWTCHPFLMNGNNMWAFPVLRGSFLCPYYLDELVEVFGEQVPAIL